MGRGGFSPASDRATKGLGWHNEGDNPRNPGKPCVIFFFTFWYLRINTRKQFDPRVCGVFTDRSRVVL